MFLLSTYYEKYFNLFNKIYYYILFSFTTILLTRSIYVLLYFYIYNIIKSPINIPLNDTRHKSYLELSVSTTICTKYILSVVQEIIAAGIVNVMTTNSSIELRT